MDASVNFLHIRKLFVNFMKLCAKISKLSAKIMVNAIITKSSGNVTKLPRKTK